ncbi:MAG: hypothetical protein H7A21_02005 [Spirochaetales bacterium]|nr:hypothetical protein [Leptospiraceae bacterium]MCP5480180.1 hypothetical protein [Spirochaetales bacterium]MCP5485480.1 hypothetical protein [Spirochaetales bacterium]
MPGHELQRRIRRLFSDNRFRRFLYSFAFGLIVVATYYVIRLIVPGRLLLYNEIVTVTFIIVSVLLLFPARERLFARIMPRQEYSAFFGHEVHHIEFMARQFTIDTLVHDVFPEFMEWLGVSAARLAVLDPSRRFFTFHLYRHGRVVHSRLTYERTNDELMRFLKESGEPIRLAEPDLPEGVRSQLEKMDAALLQPLLYQRWLTGFLILHELPRHEAADRALPFFANKAAMSIQNDILSRRVIDTGLYEQEHRTATKIQRALSQNVIPDIPGFQFKRLNQSGPANLVEFFQVTGGRWYMVILAADRFTGATGIVLYGILGYLYSYIHREGSTNMHRLLGELRQDPEYRESEYRIDAMIAEIRENEPYLVLLLDNARFSFAEVASPQKNLVSPGWRNYIDLKANHSYRVCHREDPVIDLRCIAPMDEDNSSRAGWIGQEA